MTRQVLYLDFDGVLHPGPVYRHPKRGMYFGVSHQHHTLFENAQILQDALALYPQVAIVLSTSWVRILGYTRAKSCLPPALSGKVIGAVFHSRMSKHEFDAMPRGAQVLADATRRGANRWLALDDDDEGWLSAARAHLVLTDGDAGLAAPFAKEAFIQKLRAQFGQ